jgi:Matrixin
MLRDITKSLALLALLPFASLAQQANWTGPYRPCLNSAELLKTGHMRIGVRYDISDRVVIQQFHHAFDFWAKLLDADFHDDQSTSCAVAIVDGTKALLPHNRAIVARAQLPDRLDFQGWIAVDPRASTYLAPDEAIAIWIHEIGHLLGLKHNPSPRSVMFCIDVDGSSKLDSEDLRAIASRHTLRANGMGKLRAGPVAIREMSTNSSNKGDNRIGM